MRIALCIACQYGDHDGHVARVAPREGMMGGSQCPCEGDCVGNMPSQVKQAATALASEDEASA